MHYLARKPFLVVFILTLFFIFFFDIVLGVDNSLIRGSISAGLAVFLSPRKKKISTQAGDKIQITWIFLKNPITL